MTPQQQHFMQQQQWQQHQQMQMQHMQRVQSMQMQQAAAAAPASVSKDGINAEVHRASFVVRQCAHHLAQLRNRLKSAQVSMP